MTKTLGSQRLKLALATWGQEATNPGAGAGTAAEIGSIWQRAGSFPTTPVELYQKLNADDQSGWVHQNLVNMKIFNVKDYGAVGDGVTDDRLAIIATVTAANAAGGGGVYFPPTAAGLWYNIVKVSGGAQANIIDCLNVDNVVFFGDGYASRLIQTGTAQGSETRMISIRNGCTRIRFYNFYMDAANITSPDPAEQNHGIQLVGNSGVTGAGPTDVEISEMYFGRYVGDAVRMLAEDGKEIVNVRSTLCSYEMRKGNSAGARAGFSVQRYTRQVMLHFCWLTGSHDQQIDFEPTGAAVGLGGPSDYSIIGNHMDHENQNTTAVTLSGAGQLESQIARRNKFSFNTLTRGGDVGGRNMLYYDLRGNIITLDSDAQGTHVFSMYERSIYCTVDSNIAINQNLLDDRAALFVSAQNGGSPSHDVFINNIFSTMTNSTSTSVVSCVNATDLIFIGNLCTLAADVAGCIGMTAEATNAGIITENSAFIGNMVFSTGIASLLAGFRFRASPGENYNTNFLDNFIAGVAVNGVRWEASGAGVLGMYRGAHGNNGPGVTSQMVEISTLGASMEGDIGAGAQIITLLRTAGPDGIYEAAIGSLCANNAGGLNNILFYKEADSGGFSGWVRQGGSEIVMGCATGTGVTAARFMAPGGMGLAAESTVEIEWVMPRPGKLRNLRLACIAGVAGGSNTYTVRKNGVNTLLTLTVLNTAITGSGSANQIEYAAGDRVSLQVTKTLASGTPQSNVQLTIELAG